MKPPKNVRIRPVENALTPALAYDEGDFIVVEVDAALEGEERLDAIMTALTAHKRRRSHAWLPAPLIAATDGAKRLISEHPKAAASTLGTAGAMLIVAATIAVTVMLDDRPPPQPLADPPAVVFTVTRSGATVTRSAPRTTPTRHTSDAGTSKITPPQTAGPLTSSPSLSTGGITPTTPRKTTRQPSTASIERPPAATQPPRRPTATDSPSSTVDPPTNAGLPAETVTVAAAPFCTRIVHIEVNPLLDVCIL